MLDRARTRARILVHRRSVEVRVQDAVWSLDSTQVGCDAQGGSRHMGLVREPGTLGAEASPLGGLPHGWEVVALMERVRVVRGCLPLVLATDNDSENCNAVVDAYLRRHKVVHLCDPPRTPQHNARAERVVRELKEAAGATRARWPTRSACRHVSPPPSAA